MNKYSPNWMGIAGIVLLALLLTGCASVPDSIKGLSSMPQQDLRRVLNAPQLYIGQESRFGGQVVTITNMKDKTRVEIVTHPLDSYAKPLRDSVSEGRIYADVQGFLEPADLNNRWITVIGTIKGTEEGLINQARYVFVVLNVSGFQRWREIQTVVQPMDPWITYGPGWRHPGFWGSHPWGNYYHGDILPVQTILTE